MTTKDILHLDRKAIAKIDSKKLLKIQEELQGFRNNQLDNRFADLVRKLIIEEFEGRVNKLH